MVKRHSKYITSSPTYIHYSSLKSQALRPIIQCSNRRSIQKGRTSETMPFHGHVSNATLGICSPGKTIFHKLRYLFAAVNLSFHSKHSNSSTCPSLNPTATGGTSLSSHARRTICALHSLCVAKCPPQTGHNGLHLWCSMRCFLILRVDVNEPQHRRDSS